MNILASIVGVLTGLPLGAIAKDLSAAYRASIEAKTDESKIEADKLVALAEARMEVLKAEAWSRINMVVRLLLAFPIIVLLWKIFLFDKALGQWLHWHTDPLSPELWWVIGTVLAFYFLSSKFDR